MGSSIAPMFEEGLHHYHTSSWHVSNPAAPGPFFEAGYDGGYPGADGTILERRRNATGGLNLTTLDPALFDSTTWSPDVSSGMTDMFESSGYFGSPLDEVSCTGSTSVSPPGVWIPGMDMAYLAGPSDSMSTDVGAPSFNDDSQYAGEPFGNAYYEMGTKEGSQGTYLQDSYKTEKSEGKFRPRAPSKKETKRKSAPGKDAQPASPSGTKLRTASRQRPSQAGQTQKPGESAEHQRARTTHNKVEKEYRNRLNRDFELLAAVMPPSGQVSKADVVDNATTEIGALADEIVQLRETKSQKDEKRKAKKKSHG